MEKKKKRKRPREVEGWRWKNLMHSSGLHWKNNSYYHIYIRNDRTIGIIAYTSFVIV